MNDASPVYELFLKRSPGNNRVTFTTRPNTLTGLASLDNPTEDGKFLRCELIYYFLC